jgi:hypothetical protein
MPAVKRWAKARRIPGKMNRLEENYSQQLELRKRVGEIRGWEFEKVTLKIADDCRFTPDFFVVTADDLIEFHETKGFMRDDAAVKIRVAADRFPMFKFVLVQWKSKQWTVKEY